MTLTSNDGLLQDIQFVFSHNKGKNSLLPSKTHFFRNNRNIKSAIFVLSFVKNGIQYLCTPETPKQQDMLIIDEREQAEKSKYHMQKIAESLDMELPQEIASSIERVSFDIEKYYHIGCFSNKPSIKCCGVRMNKDTYDYILDLNDLKTPFYPPLDTSISPSDLVKTTNL